MNKEIQSHKQAFLQSGKISDFQINNITKIISFCFKQYGLESFSVNYNFLDENNNATAGIIEYDMQFSGIPTYTKEEKELFKKTIEIAIKNIFFKETKVLLKRKGKTWN